MDDTLLLLFIFGFRLTSCSLTLPVIREYHYVSQPMTWTDAQNYCRVHYSDLATFESMADISRLNWPSSVTSWVWFGLTDDPKSWKSNMGTDSNSWKWSASGETSKTGYQNWNVYQPNDYRTHEACVMATSDGRWTDVSCLNKHSFVCYNDTIPPGQKTYNFIQTEVIWKDAQTYCRTYHTDLAVIETAEENTKMLSAKSTPNAWIGLYRVLWRWSDKSNSTFRNWQNGQPNNYGGQYCAAENSNHQWNDGGCHEKYSFVCQRELKMKMTLLRMKIQSDADLSDPASSNRILQQLHAVLTNRSSMSDFNLEWETQPRKQEANDEETNRLDVICN